MIYNIIFMTLAALAYLYWRYKYIPAQVARNAAAITANGSADNLQQGFHSRETWRRIWVGLVCCVVPSLSFSFSNLTSFLLSFLAMAALLGGCFARYFTPLLNLAMQLDYKPEWYASPASKSWPDAKAWKETRSGKALMFTAEEEQIYANATLKSIVLTTWYECLALSFVLAATAVWVASRAGSL